MQDHGRGRKADVGLDGEASWRIRILATSAIPKRRKGKTRGVASNRWQIYEAQLGPITRAAAWLRLNVCLWHLVGRDGRIPSLLSGQFRVEASNVRIEVLRAVPCRSPWLSVNR